MLQIKGIGKVYKTGTLVQQALDHVSLNLRDSEFVAILGQSGSGKTTLLNIIGGLDRYDDGDLVINGVSTKKYGDRDWDSYRNHTVGFVFQSYNLIPHQTILANVELALTIGGIPPRERSRRAEEALRKVGLGDHIHKKPSQLSGGQMQRVAIARALVNDPSILLADEPTGALDSDTSVQVMDLLKEVASDRLVVMVTHNPELAEQYATRIVNLRDGVIRSDSDPFEPEETEEAVHKNMGKASMSPLTALSLSFNNLKTKLTRTILVAFAGSIGIIGIAMILSLSNGVDRYIQNVEEETLQGYPLQITETGFDFSSFYEAGESAEDGGGTEEKDVRERRTVTNMLSRVTTNDLEALKAYLEGGESGIGDYVRAIEYDYGLSPQIYALRDGAVRQVNPDSSFAALGFSASEGMGGFFSSFSSTDTFHAMPAEGALYLGQYDVRAGRWPESYGECVLVLSGSGRVTDLTLYTLGLKNPKKLDEMVRAFAEGAAPEVDEEEGEYDYGDFLGIRFRLVGGAERYTYDAEYGVWSDRSEDETFMRALVEGAEELTVVGVVQPKEGASSPILPTGIAYPASLTAHVMERAADSEIVKAQLSAPDVDVFTGRRFGEETERGEFDMGGLFSVDENALMDAFRFGAESFSPDSIDLSALERELGSISTALPEPDGARAAEILGGLRVEASPEAAAELFGELIEGYGEYAGGDPATDLARLPEALGEYLQTDAARAIVSEDTRAALASAAENAITAERLREAVAAVLEGYPAYLAANGLEDAAQPYAYLGQYLRSDEASGRIEEEAAALREQASGIFAVRELTDAVTGDLLAGYQAYAAENGLPEPEALRGAFTAYLESEETQALIADGLSRVVDASTLEEGLAELFSSYSDALGGQMRSLTRQITAAVKRSFSSMAEQLFSSFSVDTEALSAAFSTNFSGEELRSLMTSLMSTERSSYESNLRKLGWADPDRPSSITIYPSDFEGKTAVKAILTAYNDARLADGEEEKVVSYTDVVDTLMSSVTDIVDAISYVLIAFVAISLVVSSIMIGVITYISVLERSKEIGILRAIGASKRNISEVFNAETFIIGALAGILGIVITELLLIPANHIIHSLTGQTGINAVLPLGSALLLIALSIVLTLIGGVIPSRKAARSDPVTALRSE